jgi:glycosyltransferase involved in cell wall biosynthesis
MLSLLKLFKSNGWRVIFASPASKTEFMTDLMEFGIESVDIELNNQSFDLYINQLSPTAVMFDRFMMEEQFGWRVAKHCPDAVRILDTEDLQCLRQARHSALKQERELVDADFFSDVAKREIAAIFRSDLSLIISDYEIKLLQERFQVPNNLLIHIPFMVSDHQIASNVSYGQRRHFVAIGNFRHAPNWDSVLYLKNLWPAIRQQLPDAELHVYGAYTPPKATALHNTQDGFMIKDRANSAVEVVQSARVMLAPLRFGAGIKGKLLDAMLTGTPSVTTPIGAEGMLGDCSETCFWPGFVADNDDDFVAAAVKLYQDQSYWNISSERCKPILRNRYNAKTIGASLLDRVNQITNKTSLHRFSNFTGAMLQHHHHKSTQYMAQWIEAKNQLESN